jgi:FkbM family methyltransferase
VGIRTVQWIFDHPLSKGRRTGNLLRFAKWQVRSRISREPHVFETANGAKLYARRGMAGVTGNLYVGLHEFEDMAFLLHFLRPDELFLDVGANVGSYTILAAASIGSRVIAFEPSADTFEALKRNIELNGLTNVDPRCEAVGSSAGRLRFTEGLDTVNRICDDGPVEVPVTTLDDACKETPSLIKIDVEGYEPEVIAGAKQMLSKGVGAIIAEVNTPKLFECLGDLGYHRFRYAPFQRTLEPAGNELGGNGIFLRNAEVTAAKLNEAPAFRVNGIEL